MFQGEEQVSKRLGLLLAVLLVGFAVFAVATPTELVFVNVPSGSAEDDVLRFQPILDHLSESLGVPIRYVVATDYASVLQAMLYGHADMARVGGFTYVQGEALFGAFPVARDIKANTGQPYDYSYVLARPELGLDPETLTPEDLAGLTIAFVSPTSTSGCLVPKWTLMEFGVDEGAFAEVFYAGSHDAAILALANGTVDLACCNDFRLEKNLTAGNITQDQYVIALQSLPVPTNPIIVRPGLGEEFIAALTGAWLTVPAEVCAPFKLNGFTAVTPTSYDVIRALAEAFDLAPD